MKDEKLAGLRAEYESIPVPPELEARVRRTLNETEKAPEKKRRSGWNAWTKTITSLAAVFALIVVLANSSATLNTAMARVPVLGPITKVVTFRHFRDQTGGHSADIQTPKIEGAPKSVNDDINAYAQTIIRQYRRDLAESSGQGYRDVRLDYTVVTDNARIFSLRFNTTITSADTGEQVRIYNLDKGTGRILKLGDMFAPGTNWQPKLTREVRRQMRKQKKESDRVSYFIDDPDFPDVFTDRTIGDSTQFYVNPHGNLVLVFDRGEVAPMYMGVCEFVIPKSVVSIRY